MYYCVTVKVELNRLIYFWPIFYKSFISPLALIHHQIERFEFWEQFSPSVSLLFCVLHIAATYVWNASKKSFKPTTVAMGWHYFAFLCLCLLKQLQNSVYCYTFKSSAWCFKKGTQSWAKMSFSNSKTQFQMYVRQLSCRVEKKFYFFKERKRVELPTFFHKWTLALLGKSFICQDSGKLLLTLKEKIRVKKICRSCQFTNSFKPPHSITMALSTSIVQVF